MSDDSLLHEKAREVIRAGKLPDRGPDHIWGGPGTGVECAICGASIADGETELEIEFTRTDRSEPDNHLVHLRCFSILEVERQKVSAGAEISVMTQPQPDPADAVVRRHGRRNGT